jgi:hypothetical protein
MWISIIREPLTCIELKGTVSRDLSCHFVHQTTSPDPIRHAQKGFKICQIFLKLFVFAFDSSVYSLLCEKTSKLRLPSVQHRAVETPGVFITRVVSDTRESFYKFLRACHNFYRDNRLENCLCITLST